MMHQQIPGEYCDMTNCSNATSPRAISIFEKQRAIARVMFHLWSSANEISSIQARWLRNFEHRHVFSCYLLHELFRKTIMSTVIAADIFEKRTVCQQTISVDLTPKIKERWGLVHCARQGDVNLWIRWGLFRWRGVNEHLEISLPVLRHWPKSYDGFVTQHSQQHHPTVQQYFYLDIGVLHFFRNS